VHGARDVVQEDRPCDADLVPEATRGRELLLEVGVRSQVLARMRLPRVQEVPAVTRVLRCELIEQRTLCGAVRSGEGAELEHDAVPPPQLRQADALPVEHLQLAVGGAFPGVEHVREGAELPLVLAALDVEVETLVV
jgi:hypothetical protein